jgi:hypothetical protein
MLVLALGSAVGLSAIKSTNLGRDILTRSEVDRDQAIFAVDQGRMDPTPMGRGRADQSVLLVPAQAVTHHPEARTSTARPRPPASRNEADSAYSASTYRAVPRAPGSHVQR